MKRSIFTSLLVVAAGAAMLAWSESEVHAFGHRWNGGSWGSSGGYGSSGGSWSSGYYGSNGGWGSSGSWGGGSYGGGSYGGGHRHRHHYRKAYRRANYGSYGSYGSYGNGSSGSYGSYGGYSYGAYYGGSNGGWGSSGGYGSSGSSGSYVPADSVPYEQAPTQDPAAPPAGPVGPGPVTYYGTPDTTAASFSVLVPADAKVFVNDNATTSTGPERTYVSRNLVPGRAYSYEVRAEYEADGKPISEVKVINLVGGAREELVFGEQQAGKQVAETAPQTKLSVHVPADAKVFLAGRETVSTGEVREFITTRLTEGSKWENYAVRVTYVRDGKPVTQEKTISLQAGEQKVLEFNFDSADQVASTR